MKRFLGILIGLLLLAPFLLSQESKPVAYISDLEGEVLFQGFEKAELNIPIFQGDELNSEKGRAEVYLGNGNFVRLDHYTRVVFAVLEEESVLLHVWNGNIYLRINTGTIEVQTASEYVSLSVGLHLIEDGTIYSGIISIQNDFDRYNDRREKEFTYRARQRYLPEELNDYEYVLYNYGGWRYDPIYGYVWIPCVGPDWNPYFYGRWAWYPIIGWTWISYEPFGWCVYHYGRWHWNPFWGCWYWIPTRVWGPAWVYWYYYGYDYIGWYPVWHHHYHHDRDYIPSHDRGLTVIRKDQLQKGNNVSSIVSREQLREKLPQKIEVKQLRTNLEIAPEKRISNRISKTKQTQTKQTQTARGTITREPTRSGTTAVSSSVSSGKKVSSSKGQTPRSSKGTVSSSKRQTSSSKGTVSSSRKKTSASKGTVSSSKGKTSSSSGKTKKKK